MSSHELMFLILSYVSGSIPTGFIVFWYSEKNDIRKRGSGNIGATNILRTRGGKAAITTLVIDIVKGAVPVIYGLIHFKYPPLIIGGGALAIAGHIFPVWLKFKGGKGVATFAGVFLVYMSAPDGIFIFPVFALSFALVLFYTKYVSISSLAAVTSAFFATLFTNIVEVSIIVFIINTLIFITHRENIERVRSGNEERIDWRING